MRLLPLAAVLTALIGCGQVRGGSQIGTEDGYGCAIIERTPFPTGIPEGFDWSAEDAVDATLGSANGETDPGGDLVSLDAVLTGEAQLVHTDVPSGSGERFCPDFLELPVLLSVEGPGVQEAVETTVNAYVDGSVHTGFSVDAAETNGSAVPPPDSRILRIDAWLEDRWSGEAVWVIESEDGTGDDGTASQELRVLWAFWAER